MVLDIFRSVAWNVECAEAGSMLGKLMGPEDVVWPSLADPVGVHPFNKVEFSEGFEECADIGAIVGWDYGAVGKTGCGVWGGQRVVLAGEVTVLGVGSVAEIRPQSMNRELIRRQRILAPGVPELLSKSVQLPRVLLIPPSPVSAAQVHQKFPRSKYRHSPARTWSNKTCTQAVSHKCGSHWRWDRAELRPKKPKLQPRRQQKSTSCFLTQIPMSEGETMRTVADCLIYVVKVAFKSLPCGKMWHWTCMK